jgi:ADP-ribosylglycohydrolase
MNNAFYRDDARDPPCSVGLGGNIAKSLFSIRKGTLPTAKYESDSEDAGIGSLMRLAAVPIVYPDPKAAGEYAILSSETTHPGALAGDACHFFAYLLATAIHWESHGKELFDRGTSPTKPPPPLVQPCENPKVFLDTVIHLYLREELQPANNNTDSKNRIRRLLLGAEQVLKTTVAFWNVMVVGFKRLFIIYFFNNFFKTFVRKTAWSETGTGEARL